MFSSQFEYADNDSECYTCQIGRNKLLWAFKVNPLNLISWKSILSIRYKNYWWNRCTDNVIFSDKRRLSFKNRHVENPRKAFKFYLEIINVVRDSLVSAIESKNVCMSTFQIEWKRSPNKAIFIKSSWIGLTLAARSKVFRPIWPV